jgi:hypothetical protein
MSDDPEERTKDSGTAKQNIEKPVDKQDPSQSS